VEDSRTEVVLRSPVQHADTLNFLTKKLTDEFAVGQAADNLASLEEVLLSGWWLEDTLLKGSLDAFLEILECMIAVDAKLQAILLKLLEELGPLLLVRLRFGVGVAFAELFDTNVGSFHLRATAVHWSRCKLLSELIDHRFEGVHQREVPNECHDVY